MLVSMYVCMFVSMLVVCSSTTLTLLFFFAGRVTRVISDNYAHLITLPLIKRRFRANALRSQRTATKRRHEKNLSSSVAAYLNASTGAWQTSSKPSRASAGRSRSRREASRPAVAARHGKAAEVRRGIRNRSRFVMPSPLRFFFI